MATKILSQIEDAVNGDVYEIKAKALESQVTISLTGNVTGSTSTDFSSNPSISTTIADGAVAHSKLATDAVQNDKIKDGEITKAKLNASAYNETDGSIADGTNANLATKTQVKAYVESVIASEGHYKGVQSLATINTWTAANLHNGDRVITADNGAGTGTLTLGNLPVVDGQECIFYVSDDQSVKIWQSSEGNYKIKQTAKSDPTASGTTITAIGTISQNANGEITATKKTIRSATTSQTGVVQLSGSIAATVSSENNKAASEKAVRDAINDLDATKTSTDGTNVQVKVTETDGKLTAVNITTDNTENKNNRVSAWQSTTDNTHYPSEKLVKKSLDGKTDKVANATSGNFAGLDSNGNLTDSGKKSSDFATSSQGSKADTAIQGVKLNGGSAITPDANKIVNVVVGKGDVGLGNVDNTADANKNVNSASKLTTARTLDGISFNGSKNIHRFGFCSTAAETAAKTVTLDDSMSFTLAKGAMVFVKFMNTNSVENPTLNVNSTGAKNIYRYGTTAPSTSAVTSWRAGSVVCLVYDGSAWMMASWLTYSNALLGQGYGTCETAEATTEKVVTFSSYTLSTGGIVAVKFTYGLCARATMNINSKGAKNIFVNGAAVTSTTCKRVLAGDIAYFVYDGIQYHFIGTDNQTDIKYRSSDHALIFRYGFGTAS